MSAREESEANFLDAQVDVVSKLRRERRSIRSILRLVAESKARGDFREEDLLEPLEKHEMEAYLFGVALAAVEAVTLDDLIDFVNEAGA